MGMQCPIRGTPPSHPTPIRKFENPKTRKFENLKNIFEFSNFRVFEFSNFRVFGFSNFRAECCQLRWSGRRAEAFPSPWGPMGPHGAHGAPRGPKEPCGDCAKFLPLPVLESILVHSRLSLEPVRLVALAANRCTGALSCKNHKKARRLAPVAPQPPSGEHKYGRRTR